MITTTCADQAPQFTLPGLQFTGLASPSRGSETLCTWRLTVEASFVSPEAHTLDRDEVFMVVRGRLRISEGGDVLQAGDVAVVPAGEPIQVSNPGDEEAQALVAITSAFQATTADGTVVGTPPWAL
jgi:mannose-6-phosphate isomerase-like protein (cupin superfamily)